MLLVLFGTFLFLVIVGMPISFALGLSSVASLVFVGGYDLTVVVQRMFTAVDSFSLMAIPFFMLAGSLMEVGGLSKRIVNFAYSFVGFITGGLGMVGVISSMIFAGVSGSAVATTAAMGSILIPSMEEKKYDRGFSAALLAAAGTTGPIIPPSIPLVVYGSIAGVSIAKLFVGGYVPGLMIGLSFMAITYVIAKKRHYPKAERISFEEAFQNIKNGILAILMPVLIIGGILLGIFTPTEAGAVACVYAFVVGFFIYKEFRLKDLPAALADSVTTTVMVMFLVAVASLFGWILTAERVPMMVAEAMLSISTNKYVILLLINILLLIMGCFIDVVPNITLLMPVLLPLLQQLNIDLVQFGVVIVVNLCVGLITPPVGTCLFVAGRIAQLPLTEIIKEIAPFIIVMIAIVLLITYVPGLVLFLPNLLIK